MIFVSFGRELCVVQTCVRIRGFQTNDEIHDLCNIGNTLYVAHSETVRTRCFINAGMLKSLAPHTTLTIIYTSYLSMSGKKLNDEESVLYMSRARV